MVKPFYWENGQLILLDQTKLPWEEVYLPCSSYREVAQAIRQMKLRGAPAIGVAAAYGLVLAANSAKEASQKEFFRRLEAAADELRGTRPTAVNLFWAIERMLRKARQLESQPVEKICQSLLNEAHAVRDEDVTANQAMGKWGATLIENGDTILTHCNAGALATAGYGTAVGVIRRVFEEGKEILVLVAETRPLLQGARLTAWELAKEGIDHQLITDSAAGYFIKKGRINKVLVGADRIAANGDSANKIGTYGLAVLACQHSIPFYVVAPLSTIDISLKSGEEIPIEQRDPEEVLTMTGTRIAPSETQALNPAFDVTPALLITAIVSECGIAYPPFEKSIEKWYREASL